MERSNGKIIYFPKTKSDTMLKAKEMGTITISVLLDEYSHLPFYYIEPDSKDLLPYVEFLDDALSKHSFKD